MEPGQLFGSYRLIQPLGEGGFGMVWKALDLRLERQVALKVLKGDHADRQRQLLHEARTACQLHHPNVATILEAGEVDGVPFLAMELVEGVSLRANLDRPMEGVLLQRVALQALSALYAAHQRGIVHRDIKPDNLLLNSQGDLKILDFGVARRSLSSLDETHQALTQHSETGSGMATGTPAYMSPEQALGQEVGPTSDQFSLGLLLWELAAGRHPFRRRAIFETLHAISQDPTPQLQHERPDLPPAFLQGIERMLAKAPEDRFQDEHQAAQVMGLDRTSQRVPWVEGLPKTSHKRILPRWLLPAAGALLALAAATGWWWSRTPTPPLAGWKGQPAAPLRILVLPLQGGGSGPESWMATSLGLAAMDALRGRKDVLPYGLGQGLPEATSPSPLSGQDLAALVKRAGADLVLHGSLEQAGDRFTLHWHALKADGTEFPGIFKGSFPNTSLLEVEGRLRAQLGLRLGLPGSGPSTKGARKPETQEGYARALAITSREMNQESTQLALPMLRKVIEGEPEFAPAHLSLSTALSNLANEAAVRGRTQEMRDLLAEARREVALAIQLDPTRTEGYIQEGTLFLREGDFESAERAALQAQKLDPLQANAHVLLAAIEARQPGPEHFQKAVDHAEKAAQLRPDDPTSHYRLGQVLTDAGQFQASLPHFDRALALSPAMEFAHLIRSNALLWSGQTEAAEVAMVAAQQIVPNFRLLKRNLAYSAFLRKQDAKLAERLRNCATLWPEGNPTRGFLEGLEDASQGRWEAVRTRYQTHLKAIQARLATLSYSEHTTLSLDLYFMARVLAQGPRRQEAKPFIELAERLYANRGHMALRDPAFAGLWPEASRWPGE